MADDKFDIPGVAAIPAPPPRPEPTALPTLNIFGSMQPRSVPVPGVGPGDAPRAQSVDEAVEIARAAEIVNGFKKRRDELEARVQQLEADFEAKNKKLWDVELALIDATARADRADARSEELIQTNADLRAFDGELLYQLKSLVARAEHHEIPLPIRKKAGNGNKAKKAEKEREVEPLEEIARAMNNDHTE